MIEQFMAFHMVFMGLPLIGIVILMGLTEGIYFSYLFIEDIEYEGSLAIQLINKHLDLDYRTDEFYGSLTIASICSMIPFFGSIVSIAIIAIITVVFIRRYRRNKRSNTGV